MKKTILFLFIFLLIFNITDEIYQPIIFSRLPQTGTQELELKLPAIIIMYDDGNIEDYTRAFPIHQKYNIPGVVAVNPAYIGKKNKLDEGHLKLLEKKGWEIANHGYLHAALIYNSLTHEVKKGDKKIKVKNSFLVEKNYDYILFNSKNKNKEKIKIRDIKVDESNNKYLELNKPLSRSYPAGNTYIQLSEKSMKKEIIDSKNIFKKLGIKIDTFVYPYNGYIKPAKGIVKNNYLSARGGRKLNQKFPDAFINEKPFDRHSLKGVSFENHLLPEDKLKTLIETTAKEEGLLIMYAHTRHDGFTIERLEEVIEIARKNDIEFMTFREIKQFY